ncbi:MAG: YgaP-like transmembrane domain [Acidobacteriota bacterium]
MTLKKDSSLVSLQRNIGSRGRLWRALIGLALAGITVGWVFAFPDPLRWLSILPGVAAIFVLFEAAAGWCAVRACGLRTPF